MKVFSGAVTLICQCFWRSRPAGAIADKKEAGHTSIVEYEIVRERTDGR
jgi:hypothetical protein